MTALSLVQAATANLVWLQWSPLTSSSMNGGDLPIFYSV